ncbi:AI-2E family transporter [Gammaproteobacteria bacterium AS21]
MEISQRWFLLIVLVVLGYLLALLGPILSPFLIAALLAYLADPVSDKLEEFGLSRTNAVIVVFSFIIIVFLLALLLLLPKLTHQIVILLKQIPIAIALIEQKVLPFLQAKLGLDTSGFNLGFIESLIKDNARQTGNLVNNILKGVASSGLAIAAWLANLVLIPVVLFYLLRDWDILIAKIHQLLPRQLESKIVTLARDCDEVLGAFIKGQLMVMLALGIIYSLGLWMVGLDLALIVGMLAGAASIVPYMGFFVGIIAAVIAAMVQFNDGTVLIWVGLVFMIGQALEGMVLTPLMVGDKIGLHPVAVIFAIMAGGQLFGFIGILIALPVAAIVMVFLRHLHAGYKQSSFYEEADSLLAENFGLDDADSEPDKDREVSN